MQRSFSVLDLVIVPRTSATSALALGTSLLSAAREEPSLPERIAKPLARLEAECEALRASRQKQDEGQALDGKAVTRADQRLDGAWAGWHNFLIGWKKIAASDEDIAQGARAQAVLDRVLPTGLRFLNLPYRDQWSESQTKLDRLGEPAMVEHVRALGGEAFVGAIAKAHTAYGEALHVTKRKAEARAQVRVREPIEALLDAVRRYVVHVAAYVDEHESDEGVRSMGRALLEPLATWKSSGGGRKSPETDAPTDEGEGEGEGPGGEGAPDV